MHVSNQGLSIKAYLKCAPTYRALLKDASCTITVSMDQPAQIGEKWGATLETVNKNFSSCCITLCDSLQRHKLRIDSEEDEVVLHQRANKLGEMWIKENGIYFDLLTIPYTIRRWNTFIDDENYPHKREIVEALFLSNKAYRAAFDETVRSFSERYYKRVNQFGFENSKLRECSLEFLKEECAALLLWAESGYQFEMYPSKRNQAMAATHELLIEPFKKNTLLPISLELRSLNYLKKKQLRRKVRNEAVVISSNLYEEVGA